MSSTIFLVLEWTFAPTKEKLCEWEICAVRNGHKTRRVTVLASPCFLIYYIIRFIHIRGYIFSFFCCFTHINRTREARVQQRKKKHTQKQFRNFKQLSKRKNHLWGKEWKYVVDFILTELPHFIAPMAWPRPSGFVYIRHISWFVCGWRRNAVIWWKTIREGCGGVTANW